jgi:signal peptidase
MNAVAVAARRAAGAAVMLAAVAALLVSVAIRTDRARVSRVLTGSMGTTIPAGSVVASRPADPGGLAAGDVVMFLPPAPFDTGGTPVVHRIVAVERDGADVLVRTKGDANAAEDPWTVNASKSTVHTIAWSSFTAGTVADVVARAGGSLLLAVVVALFASRALLAIWRPRRRGRRRAPRGIEWLRDAAA